jgi:plastocyanin
MRGCWSILLMLLLAGPAAASSGVDLRGTVTLEQRRGADAPDTVVVYYTPRGGAARARVERGSFEVVTANKEFLPRVSVVPVGSTVAFPNEDPILHNVFSVSGDNSFDLGLYSRGPGESVRFEQPGVVRIFCNVHQAMVAYLLVLDTPHSTSPSRDGSFRLEGLPPGPGTLTLWHERAEPKSLEVTLPLEVPLELTLELSRPRVPRHLDKHGQPYRRRPYG